MPSALARPNNFHLIRLLAALQVALLHAAFHLQVQTGPVLSALLAFCRLFPGVPIFFFVSGLLVSASFERHASLGEFVCTRLARVMPALWMCFAVTLLGLGAAHALNSATLQRPAFWGWCLAQLTCGQFYNPDFLRPIGVGVINGSLWTLSVELGFYAGLPLLMRWSGGRRGGGALAVFCCVAGAVDFWVAHGGLPLPWHKALTVTPLAHADLFASGVLAHRLLPRVQRFVAGHAPAWAGVYMGAMALSQSATSHFAAFALTRLALPPFVLACALTAPRLSDALLGDTDLSYGLYLYHMLAVNLCVGLGWMNAWSAVAAVLVGSAACGLLSWHAVERPAMRWMRRRMQAPVLPLTERRAA